MLPRHVATVLPMFQNFMMLILYLHFFVWLQFGEKCWNLASVSKLLQFKGFEIKKILDQVVKINKKFILPWSIFFLLNTMSLCLYFDSRRKIFKSCKIRNKRFSINFKHILYSTGKRKSSQQSPFWIFNFLHFQFPICFYCSHKRYDILLRNKLINNCYHKLINWSKVWSFFWLPKYSQHLQHLISLWSNHAMESLKKSLITLNIVFRRYCSPVWIYCKELNFWDSINLNLWRMNQLCAFIVYINVFLCMNSLQTD